MKVHESFDAYRQNLNVIDHLDRWKQELSKNIALNPKDAISHGLISEIELATLRLKLLSKTEIFSERATIQRIQPSRDKLNYRLMCECGYKNREKWRDAKDGGKLIGVEEGTYVINR
ncbi:hypothetical protein [Hahella sp. NBU794]|uniref:hypothetical protein n=1 Tax=Hahella sp. NBU794 TaxID=3422590 RepID=UPI003D6DFB11